MDRLAGGGRPELLDPYAQYVAQRGRIPADVYAVVLVDDPGEERREEGSPSATKARSRSAFPADSR